MLPALADGLPVAQEVRAKAPGERLNEAVSVHGGHGQTPAGELLGHGAAAGPQVQRLGRPAMGPVLQEKLCEVGREERVVRQETLEAL